jgi:hypothetical protein
MKGNGIVLCSPTAAGLWQGMHASTMEYKRQAKRKKSYFFVLNNELT